MGELTQVAALVALLAAARADEPAAPGDVQGPLAIPAPWEAPAAPRATLYGRIESLGTALPVDGARLEIRSLDGSLLSEATSDAQGLFRLDAPPGAVRVRVLHPDHAPLELEERLSLREALEVVYRLRPPPAAEEIVVYGERQREELSRQVFSGAELRGIPGSFGDPVRALQSLPGVARPQGLEGDIVVRGAEGINTGFYVDEMPVPFLFHMLVGKSVVNPAFIDDVEFFAGGMPSRFGEVTQAAVNVRTDVDAPEGRTREVDANLLDLSVSVEQELGDWTLRVAGRNSWVSAFIGLYAGIQVVRAGGRFAQAEYPTLSYGDLLTSIERRDAAGARWSLSLLGARDTLGLHEATDWDGDGVKDPTLQEELGLPYDPNDLISASFLRLRLRRQVLEGPHRSDTWLALGPQTQQNLLGDLFLSTEGPVYGRVRGESLLLRREDRWSLGVAHTLVGGASFTGALVTAEDFKGALSDEGVLSTEDTQLSVALYVEEQWRPEGWLVSPGLRGSYHRFNGEDYLSPEPRLNLRRTLSEDLAIKGFVGRFTQMPPIERYAQGIGNPELPLMSAWQAALGGEWRRGPWELDSSVYASLMEHLVVRDTEVSLVYEEWGVEVEEVPVFRDVDGRAAGVEALLRLRPSGPWWGWAALTVGRSVRIDPETGDSWPGDYDQPVSLTLLGSWEPSERWQLSARFRITSGQPFTPLEGVYLPYEDTYIAYEGELNADRYPIFRQLDLRVERTRQRRRVDLTTYLDLYNATWARNPLAASYNYDYTELVPVIYIPLIPSFGLSVRF